MIKVLMGDEVAPEKILLLIMLWMLSRYQLKYDFQLFSAQKRTLIR